MQLNRIIPLKIVLLTFLVASLCSCRQDKRPVIRVAAAASNQFVLEALVADFESKDSVKVQTIISSSGKLTAQIIQGAPYDLFLSADSTYPAYIYQHLNDCTPPTIYGYGYLVMWSSDNQPQGFSTDMLRQSDISKIALADPKTAPFGLLAQEYLIDHQLYDSLQHKLVFGESIAQVNQYVLTEAVDMGFSSLSVVLSQNTVNTGSYHTLSDYKQPLSMLMLPHRQSNQAAVERFFQYLQSNAARLILSNYGILQQ